MAKTEYKGLVISDIHVGAMDLERLRFEFTNSFIAYIKEMKKLDFVIVAGDFFDRKFHLGYKESIVAHAMLKELISVCEEKGALIRFVYGTESHESDQYAVMTVLDVSDKVKVIKYVEEEELLPGLNILYLPEEHIYDKKEYYSKYFKNKKKYDYIFGHGVIAETWKERLSHMDVDNDETKSKRKKTPVFTAAELTNCCNGQVYFGHYHINKNIDDKIFSIGSFSRWQFGEEGRKGFYELTFNPDKRTYNFKFIENELAQTYTTIQYGYDSKIFKDENDMLEALNHMDKLLNDDVFDHVRFMFNIPQDIENPEATVNYLKERYHTNEKVKVDIVHGYIEEKRKQQKEQIDEENEKFNFISDNNLPLEDKVNRFIIITSNKDIPIEQISLYLYKPLKEILELTLE